jgi:isopenicillin N synthase-like dioxygenase
LEVPFSPVKMTTSYSSLLIVDLTDLSNPSASPACLTKLSKQLYDVFATTGFAYLVNTPLTFSHEDVFSLAKDFFSMDEAEKMALATKTSVPSNRNTYRGYFPTQPGRQDNLKEGFEIGPSQAPLKTEFVRQRFNLTEANVWPTEKAFVDGRARLERLHNELQALASTLLSLVAVGLGKPGDHFSPYLKDSLSTLRLLHYPPQPHKEGQPFEKIKLCCTPHTDSGILTLLHQDQTGGLEVQNADGEWVPAPYVPGSIVVNIGDLMAQVSGGRFVATMHRVRTNSGGSGREDGMGRFSVPFFFEPGEACVMRSVDGGEGVLYGEYVRRKMGTWVEYQDVDEQAMIDSSVPAGIAVKAY